MVANPISNDETHFATEIEARAYQSTKFKGRRRTAYEMARSCIRIGNWG